MPLTLLRIVTPPAPGLIRTWYVSVSVAPAATSPTVHTSWLKPTTAVVPAGATTEPSTRVALPRTPARSSVTTTSCTGTVPVEVNVTE